MREDNGKKKKSLCLRPGCERTASRRGLCHVDYVNVCRIVKQGLVTMEELTEKGKILPPNSQPRERKVTAWFIED